MTRKNDAPRIIIDSTAPTWAINLVVDLNQILSQYQQQLNEQDVTLVDHEERLVGGGL